MADAVIPSRVYVNDSERFSIYAKVFAYDYLVDHEPLLDEEAISEACKEPMFLRVMTSKHIATEFVTKVILTRTMSVRGFFLSHPEAEEVQVYHGDDLISRYQKSETIDHTAVASWSKIQSDIQNLLNKE